MPDTSHEISIGDDTRRSLVRLLRVAYPHPDFPDGPYERTADAVVEQVEEDLWHRMVLTQGLGSLDAAAAKQGAASFADLDDDAALALLREMADAEFFVFVRGTAVVTLYDDHETWKLLGYEGSSFEHGGYLERGFDDLDWLPDPRIDEYDGEPLVEVADHDQPATA